MLRYVVSGFAVLALSGCNACRRQECALRFGYYAECVTVVDECRDHDRDRSGCWNGDCRNSTSEGGAGGAVSRSGGAGGVETGDGAAPTRGVAGSTFDVLSDHLASDGGSGKISPGAQADAGVGGASGTGGHASGASAGADSGAARDVPTGRIPRFDFSCVRDTQCGAGECASGTCYLACESDADCGTGDRCSVETGRRLCMPDPNPAVRCDESAVCLPAQTCVNGACHDACSTDTNCENLADRCLSGLCFPDRRPIAECVLNVECAADLVCLDSRCVSFGGD